MGRRRCVSQERQSSPDSKIEYVYEIPGTVRLLFETPSGFAIFSLAESYLKKDIEHIWTYFIGDFWCNNEVSCLYNDEVMEVMWGMQNLLSTILPQEQSEMTMEEWIPMSKGLDMVLRRHGFVVEPKMINEDIIKMANAMYDIDLRERAHSKFLHKLLCEEFMEISGVDTGDWSLLKLATAVKKMCYPDEGILVGNPYEMFSRRDVHMIENDAAKYREKMDENTILTIYKDVVNLGEDKRTVRNKLRRLVREAKEALEAEVLEEPATAGVNSKQQVDHTFLTVDPRAVPNQSNIGEGQHSIIDCMENISLHDTSNHSMGGGEVQTSSMLPQGVPAEHTSMEINALGTNVEVKDLEKEDENTTVKRAGLTPDGYNLGKNNFDVKKQAQKTGAETEVVLEKTEDSVYAEKKMLKEDGDTNVEERGATPGGDGVGNGAVDVKERVQQTGSETEVLKKTKGSAHAEEKMAEKDEEDTNVEESGGTPGGDIVGNGAVDVKERVQQTGSETEVLEKTKGSAHAEEKVAEKDEEDTNVEETGGALAGEDIAGAAKVRVAKEKHSHPKGSAHADEKMAEKDEEDPNVEETGGTLAGGDIAGAAKVRVAKEKHSHPKGSAHAEEKMAEKDEEDTNVEETGGTLAGGDIAGAAKVRVAKEKHSHPKGSAHAEEKMSEKDEEDTHVEETGGTLAGGDIAGAAQVRVAKGKHSHPSLSSRRPFVSLRSLLDIATPSPVPPTPVARITRVSKRRWTLFSCFRQCPPPQLPG